MRIVIIGAGPTSLGALYRLRDIGAINFERVQIILLEQTRHPGGLASSNRDDNNFLWDNGGHVVFSHYEYFNTVLNNAIHNWNYRNRSSFVFMRGGDGLRRFIPYPLQNNIHLMDNEFQKASLEGLEMVERLGMPTEPKTVLNFNQWLLNTFGKGLCDIFMIKYNTKVWTVDPAEMNSVWVDERVAVPDIATIKDKIHKQKTKQLKNDEPWGFDHYFQFPQYGGTGGLWRQVADKIPQGWFHYGHRVTELNLDNKQLRVELNNEHYYVLSYDVLITAVPLDALVNMITDDNRVVHNMKQLSQQLLYSRTHIVGVGLRGQPPAYLQDKSWIYFPDSDAPFYRATVFSLYASDNVPGGRSDIYWSLMCEIAEPKQSSNNDAEYWSRDSLLEHSITALIDYGYIKRSDIASQYYHRLGHGYPIPSIKRDDILASIQPWLESNSVYSRGRFGGWKYEVSSQDHSFMQGVEIVDYLLSDIPEETYPNPTEVNSMKSSDRRLPMNSVKREKDYELVVSHETQDLSWLLSYSKHVHVYTKDYSSLPSFQFNMWNYIKNIKGNSFTFLYHITTNYYNLADVTVFIGEENCDKNIVKNYPQAMITDIAFSNLATLSSWDTERLLNTTSTTTEDCTLGEYWKEHFSNGHPEAITWSKSTCFAVSRNRILSRDIVFYNNLMDSITDHNNIGLIDHYIQLLWYSIFNQY